MASDQSDQGKKSMAGRLGAALWECKWWWIIPMAVMLLMFVLLLLSSDLTGDAPFVYTLF